MRRDSGIFKAVIQATHGVLQLRGRIQTGDDWEASDVFVMQIDGRLVDAQIRSRPHSEETEKLENRR